VSFQESLENVLDFHPLGAWLQVGGLVWVLGEDLVVFVEEPSGRLAGRLAGRLVGRLAGRLVERGCVGEEIDWLESERTGIVEGGAQEKVEIMEGVGEVALDEKDLVVAVVLLAAG